MKSVFPQPFLSQGTYLTLVKPKPKCPEKVNVIIYILSTGNLHDPNWKMKSLTVMHAVWVHAVLAMQLMATHREEDHVTDNNLKKYLNL